MPIYKNDYYSVSAALFWYHKTVSEFELKIKIYCLAYIPTEFNKVRCQWRRESPMMNTHQVILSWRQSINAASLFNEIWSFNPVPTAKMSIFKNLTPCGIRLDHASSSANPSASGSCKSRHRGWSEAIVFIITLRYYSMRYRKVAMNIFHVIRRRLGREKLNVLNNKMATE